MNIPTINKDYMKLNISSREKYVYETVREIVFLNRDGVTTSLVERNAPFSRKAIEKNLEKLESLNEIFSKKYGKSIVYFPNNRAVHSTVEVTTQINEKTLRAVQIDNMLGLFIYIQEFEETSYGDEVKGGLMVPAKKFMEFVKFVNKINDSLKISNG